MMQINSQLHINSAKAQSAKEIKMSYQNQINSNQTEFMVYSNQESAESVKQANEKTIVCRFKNPARMIAVNIPIDSWNKIADIPQPYKELISGVIYNAAKSIISKYYLQTYVEHKITISTIPASFLTVDSILEEASGNNSEWLNKDELTEAWKNSETRKSIFNANRYASDRAYQKAFTRFEELILKLSGKTSQYELKDLDVILAKLHDADFNTEFGQFVIRRIEAIKSKPKAEDLDLGSIL
jgi:hypothetical protein